MKATLWTIYFVGGSRIERTLHTSRYFRAPDHPHAGKPVIEKRNPAVVGQDFAFQMHYGRKLEERNK